MTLKKKLGTCHLLSLTLLSLSAFAFDASEAQTPTETHKKPSAEQALATIGYLAQKDKKKGQPDSLHEDLRLFIKKIVLIAMGAQTETYPSLNKLDEQLRSSMDDVEMELLLNALNEAAYVIKNRAESCCSEAEIERLSNELHRWCDWATRLVNERPR